MKKPDLAAFQKLRQQLQLLHPVREPTLNLSSGIRQGMADAQALARRVLEEVDGMMPPVPPQKTGEVLNAAAKISESPLPTDYTPALSWKDWAGVLKCEDYRAAKKILLPAKHPADIVGHHRKFRIDRLRLPREIAEKLTTALAGKIR